MDKAREKEEDFVDTCLDKTKALKECLEAHPDYYAPVLVRLVFAADSRWCAGSCPAGVSVSVARLMF